MKKVHFSHRLTDNGEFTTGMPVSGEVIGQRTLGKVIRGVGVDGDNMDLVIRLADSATLTIFSSHRGAEIVYTEAPE